MVVRVEVIRCAISTVYKAVPITQKQSGCFQADSSECCLVAMMLFMVPHETYGNESQVASISFEHFASRGLADSHEAQNKQQIFTIDLRLTMEQCRALGMTCALPFPDDADGS